ncbi:SDR family oxidoreductase [Actinophytocola algeriensis]|uniref:NAD(P)H dehydrogenase (Quinone) n=1 Tax=Actinophytocola algeriensis TaxID=1768010 RepID=A0A7W7Q4A0_9PSEU|nr:SDR family oxidoreductase [Actinophytocola algeriensis]MBB4906760.1 NAD(P)H dehydrogenase (quinone) [Actinophytocola algeriensis]MBE1478241.1 NAD(P)H dehydrogenase (quinone) [Actinophytocola algeriensis]
MIVVTGATGQLGRLVVEGLRKQGATVVAGARNPAAAADLGVEVRELDYDRPATVDAALAGADQVLLISGSEPGKRVPQHTAVVDAAKRAGVRQLVYTSALHADTTPLVLAPEHKATEEAILASGLPYTFLRNGWYHENYLDQIAQGAKTGEIVGAAGDGRVASAARKDFADAAVAVLTGSGHENKAYELSGDTAWTFSEFADEIGKVAGKSVTYRSLPPAEFQQLLVDQGTPAEVAGFVAALEQNIADGTLADTPGHLRTLIGHPTTPVADTIESVLSA